MDTRHLVDPDLLPALDMFPDLDLTPESLIALRGAMADMLPQEADYAHPAVRIEHHEMPGPDGAPAVPVTLFRPAGLEGPLPVFLHIHGGGYVMGEARQNGPGNVRTARELGCLVVSVDYRLAPEAPAPAALHDCYTVLRWLHEEAAALGVDPARIAIGGESAGGGLAAALALLARDRGEVPLCFQMLIYPMIDDRGAGGGEPHPHAGEFVWTAKANAFAWACHLGHEPGAEAVSPYHAPARAADLAGLPPAYMSVGALDLFLEEDLDYARRLMRAGVPVELHVYPGAYHGFELAAGAALAREAEAERRRALARAFGVPVKRGDAGVTAAPATQTAPSELTQPSLA